MEGREFNNECASAEPWLRLWAWNCAAARFLRSRGQPRAAQLMGLDGLGVFFCFFPPFLPFLPSSHFTASHYTHGERARPPTLWGRGDVVRTNKPPQRLEVQLQGKKKCGRGQKREEVKKKKKVETKSKREHSFLHPAACVSQRLVMSLSNHFLMPLAERSEFAQVLWQPERAAITRAPTAHFSFQTPSDPVKRLPPPTSPPSPANPSSFVELLALPSASSWCYLIFIWCDLFS